MKSTEEEINTRVIKGEKMYNKSVYTVLQYNITKLSSQSIIE